jgi:MFS family permease
MSEYVQEFHTQWRALVSATIGLSCGLILNSYVAGIMGPHLLAQFGWTKSQLAGVQVLSLFTVVAFPIVGRMADIFGGRRTALVGIVTSPLLFLGFSQVTSFAMYAALFGAQVALPLPDPRWSRRSVVRCSTIWLWRRAGRRGISR